MTDTTHAHAGGNLADTAAGLEPEREDIRKFIIREVARHPRTISQLAGQRFGISRQAVNRHMTRLLDEGVLCATGNTRARAWELVQKVDEVFSVEPFTAMPELLWRDRVAPFLADLPGAQRTLFHHGFCEVFSNIQQHAESPTAGVRVLMDASRTAIWVRDFGVGVFDRLARQFAFADVREAAFELAKGRLSTCPAKHLGEALCFALRMFDTFSIRSGHVALHADGEGMRLETHAEELPGTRVVMMFTAESPRTMEEMRLRFSRPDGTWGRVAEVPLGLMCAPGEIPVTRGDVQRALARMESMQLVTVDFSGVADIGPTFADEITRVWPAEHPETLLRFTNANDAVRALLLSGQR